MRVLSVIDSGEAQVVKRDVVCGLFQRTCHYQHSDFFLVENLAEGDWENFTAKIVSRLASVQKRVDICAPVDLIQCVIDGLLFFLVSFVAIDNDAFLEGVEGKVLVVNERYYEEKNWDDASAIA